MKKLRGLKLKFLATFAFILFSVGASGEVIAATYYVATNGNDNYTGKSAAPWATFKQAMAVLQPGDTLLIKDGIYTEQLDITVSGTSGNPITIEAGNDGQVTINGKSNKTPCRIIGQSYINVRGIICKNGDNHAFDITDSRNINIKRVSGYSALNDKLFSIFRSSYILLEDCVAAGGSGGSIFQALSSDHITFRRCWALWQYNRANGKAAFKLYGTDDSIIENCIGTYDSSTSSSGARGIYVWVNDANGSGDRNKFYGNVIYNVTSTAFLVQSSQRNIQDNYFKDNVGINNDFGFLQRADDNLIVENSTMVGNDNYHFALGEFSDTKDGDFEVKLTLKNSSFIKGDTGLTYNAGSITGFISVSNSYNNYYGNADNYAGSASQGIGDKNLNPAYDTASFGKGAYLIRPSNLKGKGENGADMGAEVLYRYQDGVLTNVPLWPWPMEDRIYRETGISVTWEANGGLWKTLNGAYSGTYPTCDLAQSFEETTLSEGIEYYTDRTYTLTSIPSQYLSLPVVKTPNDERDYMDAAGYMKYELTDAGKVYVAYDCRATSLPDWMSTFTDTGDTISTSLSAQPCLRVYEKDYAAGSCVDFGANKASGTSSVSYSNYIVFYEQTSDNVSPAKPIGLKLVGFN